MDEREQILQYAVRLQGLSLLRTGDTFALVEYKITGATLDEIAAFLAADRSPVIENRRVEEHRRADLRVMLPSGRCSSSSRRRSARPATGTPIPERPRLHWRKFVAGSPKFKKAINQTLQA
jgi:hypothetical protein